MRRCASAARPRRIGLSEGEDYIVYAILDFIVDNYFPVLATINAEVEAIEDDILAQSPEKAQIDRLYTLRRDLLRLGNAVAPLVDVCQRLEHTQVMAIDPAMRPHFRDVTDHIRRVREADRHLARGAGLRLRGEPDERPDAADLHHAAARGLGRHPRRADGDRRHLRDEFRAYAGAEMAATAISSFSARSAAICATLYWRFRRNGWL